MWSWVCGSAGQLGLNNDDKQLLPEHVAGSEVVSGLRWLRKQGTKRRACVVETEECTVSPSVHYEPPCVHCILCLFLCICLCFCLCMGLGPFLCLCMCMCMCVHAYLCAYIYAGVSKCVSLRTSVFLPKSPTSLQKSPISLQQRPVQRMLPKRAWQRLVGPLNNHQGSHAKEPISPPKSPVCFEKGPLFLSAHRLVNEHANKAY